MKTNRTQIISLYNPWMISALLAGILLLSGSVIAGTWEGQLQQGGQLRVDPGTHRATRVEGDVERPIWDGVHQLDDGSTIIVRDGIAVPTEEMHQVWSGQDKPRPAFEGRYCDQLVRKTCGFDHACKHDVGCLRARSLLAEEGLEQRGQLLQPGTYPHTAASEKCRQALIDSAYPLCASLELAVGDSRCRDLVERVCGPENQCVTAQPCDVARQLLRLETDERLVNDDPSALSAIGSQCLEAINSAYFVSCPWVDAVPGVDE